ncbi:hypothetical protein [Polaromonas naphthalenivorans]|uniref:Uncharacterized protein n=1 Tax=Polaromonas naphthalenivorans (strain CJ2) TaxID=365044 RepID=A1VVL5_POLNA|nr:hypothetical protein [Polaromonas naphthalenivorans]ABM39693.1 hypothetical protein Pnap_4415 [Polaromonas naphthalenivorans CJ2]
MDSFTPENLAKATEILEQARAQLQAIGLHCMLSSTSLPQGLSVSLHVAQTELAVVAAHVASGQGGSLAHTADGQRHFVSEVADMAADLAIDKARR